MFDEKDLQYLKEMEGRLGSRMDTFEGRMDALEGRMDALEERMDAKIDALEKRIDTKMDALEKRIDTKMDALEKRIDTKMEERIGTAIRASESRMMAYFESVIIPRFDLLAEGQQMIRETLAPKSRVEALEDEVAFMKQVIRAMTQDIAELKQAQ